MSFAAPGRLEEIMMQPGTGDPSIISVPKLRTALAGRVIAPDDDGFDEARTLFAGNIDKRPALIVKAANVADVSSVVSLSREAGLELAVRSGGHSMAGHSVSDGGMMLDLRDMKSVEIDVEGRSAWAETGLTAGEYTTAAGVHGLATGFGDTGSVGIGGITLGGGVGLLVRKHGLTVDDLLAAEVVTADGQLLHVDAETHPDLFWAIRGGGGNFGVATRFRFRLHEVDTIVGGMPSCRRRPPCSHRSWPRLRPHPKSSRRSQTSCPRRRCPSCRRRRTASSS
jgi:FAD/FMN-containing dehydrogenase